MLNKVLNYYYETALLGAVGFDSAEEIAREYMKEEGTLDDKIESLIKWETAKCGAFGFLTGFGGVVTFPIAIPVDITTNFFVQTRMIAAIALMTGHDPNSEKVKLFMIMCISGNAGKEFLKKLGLKRLGKLLPVLGGVLGGSMDASACRLAGTLAKTHFMPAHR